MLCAPDELGLPGGHDGLLVLKQGEPGEDLAELLGLDTWVLDVSVLPNRPDCLSLLGIAREVAAILDAEIKLPAPKPAETGSPIQSRAKIEVLAPDLCPRYLARLFTDVKIAPSPKWLAQRVLAAGMRPINNVVDITNYVMLEYGQPLHAFDFGKLQGAGLIVRRARPGETIVTLDGQSRELTEKMLVISDRNEAACIAGIMGGDRVEIDEGTTSILLEAASFARGSVRRTSRALGLSSESSLRFERGVDPSLPAVAIERAAELLEQLCGATTAKGRIDLISPAVANHNTTVTISQQYITGTAGTEIPSSAVSKIFRNLDLPAVYREGQWSVTIPPRRGDLERKCDLLEEIVRLWGFEKIPATLPSSSTQGADHSQQVWEEQARASLLSMGINEAISYTFLSPGLLEKTNLSATPLGRALKIANPLSDEQSLMRTTLLPSLLQAASHNLAHQQEDLALFEVGKIFQQDAPQEKRALGIVLIGKLPFSWWRRQENPVDFFTMKGVVEECLSSLKISGWQLARPKDADGKAKLLHLAAALHPGRSAAILLADKAVGIFGELAPQTAEAWDLPRGAQAAELDLESLWPLRSQNSKRFNPLPRFPSSFRDLALLVPDEIPAGKVQEIITSEAGELLVKIELFDLYSGAQVPEGMRSLAFRLQLASRQRTIQEQEIESLAEKILGRLTQLGITLR
jgi:phenylalanyl-tRNA synthetase beta chain